MEKSHLTFYTKEMMGSESEKVLEMKANLEWREKCCKNSNKEKS